jgi:hypothetical protein
MTIKSMITTKAIAFPSSRVAPCRLSACYSTASSDASCQNYSPTRFGAWPRLPTLGVVAASTRSPGAPSVLPADNSPASYVAIPFLAGALAAQSAALCSLIPPRDHGLAVRWNVASGAGPGAARSLRGAGRGGEVERDRPLYKSHGLPNRVRRSSSA